MCMCVCGVCIRERERGRNFIRNVKIFGFFCFRIKVKINVILKCNDFKSIIYYWEKVIGILFNKVFNKILFK